MDKFVRENIDQAQELAKQQIDYLLKNHGYILEFDEHNTEGIETRLIQWKNLSENHYINLCWDGREQWFDLSGFDSLEDQNFSNAELIILMPFQITKRFNRKKYINKTVGKLLLALKEKINGFKTT